MKILWVTAQILPLVADDMNCKKNGFGGWVMNMLNQLKEEEEIELGVAMVSSYVSELYVKRVDNIMCFVAPQVGQKGMSEKDRDSIIEMFSPDIIHVEGNEFSIHNVFAKNKRVPTLVSLQGILSGYEPYQYGEIPIVDLMFNVKKHHVIDSWILFLRKQMLFDKRIAIETDTISNADYIMGRTFWDRAHSYWINPRAKYFECNRILRPTFYQEKWLYENTEQHSIFVGNGYSALKGLHFVIEAINLLKEEYKDIKVYVAGKSPIVDSEKLSLHKFGYSKYIHSLIEKYNLKNNVVFMGELLEAEMIYRMKRCNVYVLPSLIENSPNTLGEAMMLGMPCVSAYVGGAPEMAVDEKECLFYRSNDPKLLAWQIKRVFDNEEFAKMLGQNAQEHAIKTHDPVVNKNALLDAYASIMESAAERNEGI